MLQINVQSFASDALEDAMRLAQTKALNSYTFSDCLNYLNYSWSDIYTRMAQIDDGYYGVNIPLTSKLTKLPAFVKSTVQVYAAQSPLDSNRLLYREAGTTDMVASQTYKISGNEIYCADATARKIWLYFVPACPQIFFTHHNRDPKLYEYKWETVTDDATNLLNGKVEGIIEPEYNFKYNIKTLKLINIVSYDLASEDFSETETYYKKNNITIGEKIIDKYTKVVLTAATYEKDTYYLRNTSELASPKIGRIDIVQLYNNATGRIEDITDKIVKPEDENGKWNITYISCDYPYIFVTYEHDITKEHISGFFDKDLEFTEYNPFQYTGRASDVEYIKCHWNDKTGLGVIVKDWSDIDSSFNYTVEELEKIPEAQRDDNWKTNYERAKSYVDMPRQKELGWTPDTQLNYPVPEMYRYLVARLADKFSALNESNVMGVQKELVEARYAFEACLDKDKSAFKRIANVNPPTIGDWL